MRKVLAVAVAVFLVSAVAAMAKPRRVYDVKTVTAKRNATLITVVAKGRVNTGGWSNPHLVQTGKTATTLTFEFVAEPPPAGKMVPQVFVDVEATKTTSPLKAPFPTKVKVLARTNSKTVSVKK